MTIIIDKNDRGARAPVAQTAHFRQKSITIWFPNAPPKTWYLEISLGMTLNHMLGNQAALGFGSATHETNTKVVFRENQERIRP